MSDWFKSAVITFVSGFILAIVPFLGDLTWDKSAVMALILVGIRAGLKVVAVKL